MYRLDPTRRRSAGFSLVELIVVLVILAMMAAIITVNWRAILPKTELHSAVRDLAATLQTARSESISRNSTWHVQYDVDKSLWRIVTPYREGGVLALVEDERVALPWKSLPDSVRFQAITVDGLEYTKGLVWARFDPIGTASTHTVLLVQPATETRYTIEVQGLLGLIDYREGVWVRPAPREDDFK
jgi:type II secretion system protein H